MNIVTLGLGPSATLTGFLLVGLAVAPEAPEVDCTELIAYDFTAAAAPFYPVANQAGYWRHPDWDPPVAYDPPTAGFPDLTVAQNADIIGGELTSINTGGYDPADSVGIFGTIDDASGYEPLVNAYGGGVSIYAEVGVNFYDALYDANGAPIARLVSVFAQNPYDFSYDLRAIDADGPPTGTIVLSLRWCNGAGTYATETVATKPRSFADGVHTFRVEMTPSTPLVPGSTINHDLRPNGIARVYVDSVLEYENAAIEFRMVPASTTQINDAFVVGAVGLGGYGFAGGYTYLQFGYCEVVEVVPPTPPPPGGTLPPGVEPLVSDLPVGITRLFALLTWGEGSPYSQIKVCETTLHFDPPEWYGGHGYPWLIWLSPITRVLSDSLQGVEATLEVADPLNVFRALALTDGLSGATWEIFLVSDTVRYALGEPHRRFAGKIHDYDVKVGGRFSFQLRDVLTEEMGALADAPRMPPGRLFANIFPGMTKEYEGRAIPIAIGEVSDEGEDNPQGVVPPLIVAPSINLAAAFGGLNVDVVAAILSHGALPPNGLLKGYYNTVDDPYNRIPIPPSAYGTLLTAPGLPGWNYVGVDPDVFVDYPDDPQFTHRYTPVFFLASDPNIQAVVDGRIQVAFNLCGLTENADGSGLYYADAPDVYEFLIRNWLYPPHWRYGDYNDTPTFLAGYTIVNHDSVVRARDRLRAFMGSPGGYPVGFLLGGDGQQATLRHVLTELCYGVLMEQGIDRHGRILLDVEDVNAVATISLTDIHDIVMGEFVVKTDRGSMRNNAQEYHGFRYLPAVAPLPTPPEGQTLPVVNLGSHQDWAGSYTYAHDDAIAANSGKETAPLQIENRVIRNSDVAQHRVEREIARLVGPGPSYKGQRLFTLPTSWSQRPAVLDVELGDVIEMDTVDGLGPTGYEGQRGRVLKITDDLQHGKITFEGRVLHGTGSPS